MSLLRWSPIVVLILSACATPGAIERQPVGKPLGSYASAALLMAAADPSATNAAQRVSDCRQAFEVALNAAGVFPSILSEEQQAQGALLLKSSLVDQTNEVLGIKEKAKKIEVTVDFIDTADQNTVGSVMVLGNSEQGGRTTVSVGGVDVESEPEAYRRACQLAAEQLSDYVKAKK
ncbi:MAG: hypothetical protein IPG45_18280 [Deltaproteobacteria bacterium]|nr:hypothetical protein [Deltaproteobacteria bacterium]